MVGKCQRIKAGRLKDPQLAVASLVAYMLNAVLVTELVRALCVFLSLSTAVMSALCEVVRDGGYILSFVLTLKFIWKKIRVDFIIIPLVFLAAICLTIMLVPSIHQSALWEPVILLFLRCIPLYMIPVAVKDFKKVVEACIPYIYLALAYFALHILTITQDITNYMTFSYCLLVPTIISMILLFQNKKIYLFHMVCLIAAIAFFGARGPLLCLAASGIAIMFIFFHHFSPIKLALISLGFLLLCGAVIFWKEIIQFLMEVFPDSRTLYILTNFDSLEQFATGRLDIYNAALQLIGKNLTFGYGVMRDRYYLSIQMGYADYQAGIVPHNLLLEFLLEFGVPIGIGLFILVLIFLGRTVIKARKIPDIERMFVDSIIVASFFQLMVSGSYIENHMFWFGLGICVSFLRKKEAHHGNLG